MLHCGSRQHGLQAEAADPYVPLREGCGADGQEHDDVQGHQGHLENNPALEKLLPHIQGNLGYVFTKQDLTEIRDMLLAILPAATCAGAIALCEVTVPSQITGLEPEKTSFFKALGFATKISKVPIEILSNGPLIKTGDKVGVRKAMLLNIFPFSFGLIIPVGVRQW